MNNRTYETFHQFRHTVESYDDAFRAIIGIINDGIGGCLHLAQAA